MLDVQNDGIYIIIFFFLHTRNRLDVSFLAFNRVQISYRPVGKHIMRYEKRRTLKISNFLL